LHCAADPVPLSTVHALPSLHVVGHSGPSQTSPGSVTPLPHIAAQSLSLAAVQNIGQQPSPSPQLMIPSCVQRRLQLAALPVEVSVVHELPSLHVAGQLDGGSQVSPGSMTPLPHVTEQSRSLLALQPAGQHASLLPQVTIAECAHARLQLAALPVAVSIVHALSSLHVAGQLDGGSQVSPGSMTLLPQVAEHSASLFASQPAGQQPSPLEHVTTAVRTQATLQFSALPVVVSTVHALPSLHVVGQVPGGSQVSPGSITPLPHVVEQSPSLFALQPAGQQPSPLSQLTIAACVQARLQFAALPVAVSRVHALPSLHDAGQVPGGSQVSPGSITLLPQVAEQSASLFTLQPAGQHASPPAHALIASYVQATLQVAALPVIPSRVHALPSLQDVGQTPGGSQVSPGSRLPLPQVAEQSASVDGVQPAGQHPSPPAHAAIASCVQARSQLAALPAVPSRVHALPSLHDDGQLPGGSQVSPGSSMPLPQFICAGDCDEHALASASHAISAARPTCAAPIPKHRSISRLPVCRSAPRAISACPRGCDLQRAQSYHGSGVAGQ